MGFRRPGHDGRFSALFFVFNLGWIPCLSINGESCSLFGVVGKGLIEVI